MANLVSSLVMALQSVIMLIFISNVGTLVDAGVFTFGYANANLLINLGRFGITRLPMQQVATPFRHIGLHDSSLLD